MRELEHLAGHGVLEAVHARDAVADRDDAADFGDVDIDGVAADLLADDLGNLVSFDVHRPAMSAPMPRVRSARSERCTTAARSSSRTFRRRHERLLIFSN